MQENDKHDFQIFLNIKKDDVNSQHKRLPLPKNIFCIEGGGTKGVYAIGILKYLFENNPYFSLSDVDIFGGTSVGSFLAAPLSLGYQREDILAIAKMINIGNLIDSKFMFVSTIYRFISRGHFYDDYGREEIIKQILNYKIDIIKKHLDLPDEEEIRGEDLTFGHLKKLIEKFPEIYKHLLINVVDLSRNEQIFMTTLDDKYDNIKLFDAIMATSSIPFIFKAHELYYNAINDKYDYEQLDGYTINHLVDGGVSTNNPLDYFLLNNEKYSEYNIWLLKFTSSPQYVEINGTISLLKQLMNYLISGKNDIKMNLIHDIYKINIINLYSKAGSLETYNSDEVQQIIDNIYNQFLSGKLYFGNARK